MGAGVDKGGGHCMFSAFFPALDVIVSALDVAVGAVSHRARA